MFTYCFNKQITFLYKVFFYLIKIVVSLSSKQICFISIRVVQSAVLSNCQMEVTVTLNFPSQVYYILLRRTWSENKRAILLWSKIINGSLTTYIFEVRMRDVFDFENSLLCFLKNLFLDKVFLTIHFEISIFSQAIFLKHIVFIQELHSHLQVTRPESAIYCILFCLNWNNFCLNSLAYLESLLYSLKIAFPVIKNLLTWNYSENPWVGYYSYFLCLDSLDFDVN